MAINRQSAAVILADRANYGPAMLGVGGTGDGGMSEQEQVIRELLDAISEAERVGCLDHLDCWDEANERWYAPIARARKLIA
jgi:hypothetical protein